MTNIFYFLSYSLYIAAPLYDKFIYEKQGGTDMNKIALQLYSIKELCGADFKKALASVADVGYDGVEFAGYYDIPSSDMKKILDDLNLLACGSHSGMDALGDKLSATIDYNLAVGSKHITCPGLPDDMTSSAAAWKKTADTFNKIGKKCKAAGVKFGYHNHAFEFQKFDGKFGLEILLDNTDPELVTMEFDTAWVEFAGEKTIDWMKRYPRHSTDIIHLKELKKWGDPESCEVGYGVLDFPSICDLAKDMGISWYIVEQEEFDRDQVESIKMCCDYVRSIL